MKIVCESCRRKFNIPDAKLPAGKKVMFHCPACKAPIRLDLRSWSKPQKRDESPPPDNFRQKRLLKKPASARPHAKKRSSGNALKYRLLKTIGDLPAVPEVVTKMQVIISDKTASIKDLAKLIQLEPAIAAKILNLVNSAYFGLTQKVASIQTACSLLGQDQVREVLTMAAVSNLMEKKLAGYNVDSRQLWRHSLAVAFGSNIIARKTHPSLEGEIFTAGLIHDVGKTILDKQVYDRRDSFDTFVGEGAETFLNAEREILGFDHAEIAFELCLKWNIPEEQAQGIRYHHCPSQSQESILAYIIHVSDCMAMNNDLGYGIDSGLYQTEQGAREFLSLKEEDDEGIMNEVMKAVQESEQEIA